MKICTKDHRVDFFGDVPKDSLWEDDHPVTLVHPRYFKAVAAKKGDV